MGKRIEAREQQELREQQVSPATPWGSTVPVD
jgi:hypothetical protein